ncbi:uncharacterized protein LOC144356553 [Saccoglossus kowalevskii]
MVGKHASPSQRNHHEQTDATQKKFATQVDTLVRIIEGMGSPFEEESQDFLRLHSKDIMDKQSIECLTTIQSKGQEQYGIFVNERLRANIKPITATITRNKVVLFNEQAHKSKKTGTHVNLLKKISCQNINLFPSDEEQDDISNILLDYRRSETAMSIIALSVMVLGEVFMLYAYKQNKYMITRLTGILFLLSVVAILACIQLFQAAKRPVLQSVQQKVGNREVESGYSWSFGFGWISFTLVLVSGVMFLFLSRKKKKRHGVPYVEEEEEDDDEDQNSAPLSDI